MNATQQLKDEHEGIERYSGFRVLRSMTHRKLKRKSLSITVLSLQVDLK
jgi:hypothetical protein